MTKAARHVAVTATEFADWIARAMAMPLTHAVKGLLQLSEVDVRRVVVAAWMWCVSVADSIDFQGGHTFTAHTGRCYEVLPVSNRHHSNISDKSALLFASYPLIATTTDSQPSA